MNSFELLENEACEEGVDVVGYDFRSDRIRGLYCDGTVAISKHIDTITEKTTVLAEELGHHYTPTGNILDQTDVSNRKQERHARIWAYDKLIGLSGIIRGFEAGCKSRYELAEFLGVTEEFLQDALDCYESKFGSYIIAGKYVIIFVPTLTVIKSFNRGKNL